MDSDKFSCFHWGICNANKWRDKEMKAGIYKITSSTGRVYIGQSWNVYDRLQRYSALNCKSQKVVYRSLLKHGVKNHTFEVICWLPDDCTQDVMNEYEKIYIVIYKEAGVSLMNIREGGSNGKHSPETIAKFIGNKGGRGNAGKIRTKENRKKISDSLKARTDNKGEAHHMVRLTEKIVLQIRKDNLDNKLGCRRLAKKYSISKTHATDIITKKTWKHI